MSKNKKEYWNTHNYEGSLDGYIFWTQPKFLTDEKIVDFGLLIKKIGFRRVAKTIALCDFMAWGYESNLSISAMLGQIKSFFNNIDELEKDE